MKPNIITIDKKKFLKLLAASNVGYVSSLYDRTAVKRALDQATVTALNEDEYYRNKFAKQFEKFTNSKLREEPTPEPEECEHSETGENSELENFGDCLKCGKHIRSKFSGLLLAQFDEPKSKVPEKLIFTGTSNNFSRIVSKLNEVLDYLKEKEDNGD